MRTTYELNGRELDQAHIIYFKRTEDAEYECGRLLDGNPTHILDAKGNRFRSVFSYRIPEETRADRIFNALFDHFEELWSAYLFLTLMALLALAGV